MERVSYCVCFRRTRRFDWLTGPAVDESVDQTSETKVNNPFHGEVLSNAPTKQGMEQRSDCKQDEHASPRTRRTPETHVTAVNRDSTWKLKVLHSGPAVEQIARAEYRTRTRPFPAPNDGDAPLPVDSPECRTCAQNVLDLWDLASRTRGSSKPAGTADWP